LNRIRKIHNTSKHQLAEKDQPVWITNEGIEGDCLIDGKKSKKTERVKITFEEIEKLMRECGKNAMNMYSPEITWTLQSIALNNT
jgi:hypothetical protein